MKTFTKILEEIKGIAYDLSYAHKSIDNIETAISNTSNRDKLINNQANIINEQNKIINDLINNIYSQNTSLEAVMIIPYRGNPKLFKDGKRLDTDKMTGFDIDWSRDSRVEVTVRND